MGMITLGAAARDDAVPAAGGGLPTNVYDDVMIELRRAIKLGRAVSHRQVKAFDGVAPALFGVLVAVDRSGPMRTTAIAELLHVDVSVASRQLGELEHLGLVERHPDPVDARAFLVAVTAAGRTTITGVRARQREIARLVLAGWEATELETFVAGLRRFNDDMIRGAFDDAVPQ